jgi:hypothetical protein
MNKYNIISLGYICNVISYANSQKELKKNLKKGMFDRIATPMWALNELIKNDFEDFFLDENIKENQLFDQSKRKEWYDSKYYVRFLKTTSIERIRNILDEKKNNMVDLLKNETEPILFIRCAEIHKSDKMGQRIIFDQYKSQYSKEESEYVKEFSDILKSKYPNLKFKILYVNFEKVNSYDMEKQIITISTTESEFSQIEQPKVLKNIIEKNKAYIEEHL